MNLLLLTGEYPFGSGEQFLDVELSVLADRFEVVHIVPIYFRKNQLHPPKLPSNCIVHLDIHSKIHTYASPVRENGFTSFLRSQPLFHSTDFLKNFLRMRCIHRRELIDWHTFSWALSQALEDQINLKDIDVIYSYWARQGALAGAYVKKRYPKITVVSRGHGYDVYSERQGMNHLPYFKEALSGLDGLFLCSEDAKSYVTRKYPEHASKIHRSYLGVIPQGAASSSDDGILRIVSCSNIIPLKRIEEMAKALNSVSRKIHWTHMGDGPLRSSVENIIRTFPSSASCVLTGQKNHEDVMKFYRENPVDLFLNFSTSEGIPVSMMEAMASGIPCAAPDVGGVSELLNDECGWLLSQNTEVDDLSSFIEETDFSSPAKKQAAQNRQRSLFHAQKNYQKFYEDMLFLSQKNQS